MHLSASVVSIIIAMGYFTLPATGMPTITSSDDANNADIVAAVDAAAVTDAPTVSGGTPITFVDTAAGKTGQAHVRNQCKFPVYLYVCGQHPASCTPIHKLAAKGGYYAETYSSVNNGRSIKVGKTNGEVQKPILQLEYTNTGTGQVSYDISDVNGNPFGPYGFTLTTSNPKCFSNHCAPPATSCSGVFTNPTNGVPHDCPIGDDIGVTLCG